MAHRESLPRSFSVILPVYFRCIPSSVHLERRINIRWRWKPVYKGTRGMDKETRRDASQATATTNPSFSLNIEIDRSTISTASIRV